MTIPNPDRWIEGDPGVGLDPVEDGQAECHRCGEWYHVTAPFGGHTCTKPCPDCDGKGEVLEERDGPLGSYEIWMPCETCDGTGEIGDW